MFYIFLLIFVMILSFIKNKIKQKRTIDYILIILMSLTFGVRYDVGIDYLSYQKQYYDTSGFYGQRELLYDLSMKIFRSFDAPFWVYSLFLGFVIYFLIYNISKEIRVDYAKVMFYFILTGLMFVSFNLVRQVLAGLVVIYALRFINKKNFFKYIISIAIATLIHYSAMIFIPFYYFNKINIIKRKWIIIFVLGFFLYITNILNNFFVYITPIKYRVFIGSNHDYNVNPGIGVIFFVIIALILAYRIRDSKDKLYPYYSVYIMGYTALLFTMNSFIMTRFNIYSQIALVFVLSNEFDGFRISTKVNRIIENFIIIGFVLIFTISIVNIYGLDNNNLMYYTVFD